MLLSERLSVSFFLLMLFCASCSHTSSGPDDGDPPCNYCPFDFRLTDSEPAWSPDGNTIAYVHGGSVSSRTGIYLIDTDGKNKRLVYASVGASAPTWSPDGQWIAFSDNAQIYKIKVTGDSLTQLTFEGRNFFPAWSPDGKWIAYSKSICEGLNTCGIWLMSSSGQMKRFVDAFGNFPNWHPSSEKILYLIPAVTQSGKVLGDSLFVLDINTGEKNLLTFLGGQNYDNRYPKYSPDGTKVAFTSPGQSGWPQIWVMDADGTNLRQLTTTQGYTCDWSPDGEWIVYTDSRAVNGRLWIMRSDGSNPRQLTFDEEGG